MYIIIYNIINHNMVLIDINSNLIKFMFNQSFENYKLDLERFINKLENISSLNIKENKKYLVEYNIYVLSLDDEALYVGRTTRDVSVRLKEHQRGIGSEFTKIYKYGKIEKLIDFSYQSDDKYLDIETNLAFCLMKKFGYKNVRGGVFNKVVINKDPTKKEEHLNSYDDYLVEEYIEEIYDLLKEKSPNSILIKEYENNVKN